MVSRLVQEQDIRAGQEQLTERHPGFLTSGERVCLFGEFLLRKSQSFQYSGDFAFTGISVPCFKF